MLTAALTILALAAPWQSAEVSDAAVRQAVTRILTHLEKGADAWIEQRGCVSCHTVGMAVWTTNEARRRGLAADRKKSRAWTDWALAGVLAQGREAADPDTISQLILAREPNSPWRVKPALSGKTTDPYESLWQTLADHHHPEGYWRPDPQRRDHRLAATLWAALAINSRDSVPDMRPTGGLAERVKRLDEGLPAVRQRALAWIRNQNPDDNLETQVLRMLVERKAEPALAQIMLLELFERQNADGGWAYRKGAKESDAFATGLALYAAITQGHPPDNAEIRRARAYLLRTMQEDGSWRVPTTAFHPVADGKDTAGTDAIYSYWGTAWAALGLLHTLPASTPALNPGRHISDKSHN